MNALDEGSKAADDEVFNAILEEDQEIAALRKVSDLGMSKTIEQKYQHLQQKRQENPDTYWRRQRQIRQALARNYPERFEQLPQDIKDQIFPHRARRPLSPRDPNFFKLFKNVPEYSLAGRFKTVEEMEQWFAEKDTGSLQSDMLDRAVARAAGIQEGEEVEAEAAEGPATTAARAEPRKSTRTTKKKTGKMQLSAKAKGKQPVKRSKKDIPSPGKAKSPAKKRVKRSK